MRAARRIARLLAGPGMILAGLNHFRVPRAYERIVPGYLPQPRALVAISGAAEVLGGIAAMHPRTRPLARPWLLALLAAVTPVHVWMLQRPDLYPRIRRPLLWGRLALQPVLGWVVVVGTRQAGVRAPYAARMSPVQRVDFIGIPSQDADRARAFYRDVLGLRPDDRAQYEQWAGDTCIGVWEPEKVGMPFVAQKGNPLPLGVEDVPRAREELEAKGVQFFGDILDTGVCHMAFFNDPDGNDLMLHHRYAP